VSARGLLMAALLSAGWAQAAPVPPGSATTGKAKRALGTGVLNLNTATLDQIDALPGVSPKLAAAVVAERAAHPFGRPEDLMRVRGMSRKRFERLRPHLSVTGPKQLRGLPGASAARRTGGAHGSLPPRTLSRGDPWRLRAGLRTGAGQVRSWNRPSSRGVQRLPARSAAPLPRTPHHGPCCSPVHPGRTERGPGLSPRLPRSRALRFCREPAALRPGDRVSSYPAARGSGGNDRRPLPPHGAPAAGARGGARVVAPRLGRGGLWSGAGRPARARLAARGAGGGGGRCGGSGRRAHLAALDARRGESVPHRTAGGLAHARCLAGPARRPRAPPRDGARSVVLHGARARSPPSGGRADRPARRPGSGGPGRGPPGRLHRARCARRPGAGLCGLAGPDAHPARRPPARRQLRRAARPRADHRRARGALPVPRLHRPRAAHGDEHRRPGRAQGHRGAAPHPGGPDRHRRAAGAEHRGDGPAARRAGP
jgi:competence protein ComEA